MGNTPSTESKRLSFFKKKPTGQSVEDALATLHNFDTVIIVDDSGSMLGKRWTEACMALADLANLATLYDTDGIEVFFLNNSQHGSNMRTSDSVRALFESVHPYGATPIGQRLEQHLLAYLNSLDQAKAQADAGDPSLLHSIKARNFVLITDGEPTDDPIPAIVSAARRLDTANYPLTQVGIQFVQIGNDPGATAFLKELDDDLVKTHGIRDMVDTTPSSKMKGSLDGPTLTKILLGGVNKRIDKRK